MISADTSPRTRLGARGRFLIAFALAAALLLTAAPIPAEAAFSGDVAGSVYEPAIAALRQVGIVGPEWSFTLSPQQLLTRAEEARLLARAVAGGDSAYGFRQLRFPDVASGHWAKPYIDTAVLLKLMPGKAGASFNPDGKVSRGQYASDILHLCGYDPAGASAAMTKALELGLLDSADPSTYAYITRGDATTMAYRAFFGLTDPDSGSTLVHRVFGSRLRAAPAGETAPTLELHFLPGIGATLVRLPSGADWLVGTGSPAKLPSLFAYLRQLGVDRVDALIITDAEFAPAGAVAAVTDRLSPGITVRLDDASGAAAFPAALLAQDKDIKVDLISRGSSHGNYSTALRISRGTLRVLVSEGLSEAGEQSLAVQDKAKLAADVWLPARLGLAGQHDFAFMSAVAPSYVVGGAAADPVTSAFYEGLTASGAQVLVPGEDGVVKVAIGAKTITVLAPTSTK